MWSLMSHSNPHFCKLSTVTVSSQHNTHYMYGHSCHTQILIFALNCNCHSQHTLIPRTCLYALCKFCSYRETSLIKTVITPVWIMWPVSLLVQYIVHAVPCCVFESCDQYLDSYRCCVAKYCTESRQQRQRRNLEVQLRLLVNLGRAYKYALIYIQSRTSNQGRG